MAAGDLTKHDDVHGTQKVVYGTIEGPTSYATGGITPNPANFGLTSVDHVQFELVRQDADEAMVARFDRATGKVLIFQCINAVDALQEIPNATNVSTFEIRFMAFGH